MIVKVCGVRTPEVAEAAIGEGADWIGLMFEPASPRWVDDTAARRVIDAVGGRALLVGVFVDPTLADCDAAAGRYRLGAVQVHGHPDPSLAAAASVPVIPAINVRGPGDAYRIDWWPDVLVMLDGAPDPDPDALPGGTGRRVEVRWAAEVARHRPVLLAGGLGADTVAAAVAAVRPHGVDASSSLESAPGQKDVELVRAFVRAARAAGDALAVRAVG